MRYKLLTVKVTLQPTISRPVRLGVRRPSLLRYQLPMEVEVNLRPTVSRPVCLGVRRPSGTLDQFFFLLKIPFRHLRVCYFVAPSLTRGWVCNLLYNCFWTLPEQSLLGRSPAEHTTIFYCLIWDSPNLEGQSQSQSYITTDSQAPIWDPRPIFLSPWDFLLDSYCLLFCSALFDERTGL
jgi:hypothetical protein